MCPNTGGFLLVIFVVAGLEVLCVLSHLTSFQDQAYINSIMVSALQCLFGCLAFVFVIAASLACELCNFTSLCLHYYLGLYVAYVRICGFGNVG